MTKRRAKAVARSATLLVLLVTVGSGCVERQLRLHSDPPGALVYLNGEEVARTPATVPFEWYGRYDVVVRKEGYETLEKPAWVVAPWWQWVPIDLIAEVVPIRLTHRPRLDFELEPAQGTTQGLLERAEEQRRDHESDR